MQVICMDVNLDKYRMSNAVIKKECRYTNCSALMKGSGKSGIAKTTCMV
jgi:hypothetical protein